MKFISTTALVCAFACVLFSCQKELPYDLSDTDSTATPMLPPTDTLPTGNDTLTEDVVVEDNILKVVQGTGGGNDTVYLLSYNTYNTIGSIIDSAKKDSLIGSYNADTTLEKINFYANRGASPIEQYKLIYDANKRLTELRYAYAGIQNKLVFHYSNIGTRLPSQKDVYKSPVAGAELQLVNTYKYVFTNGDITKKTEYDAAGQPTGLVVQYTYTEIKNIFKNLSFFNIQNYLGLEEIMNDESLFNRHLTKSYRKTSQNEVVETVENLYVIDSRNELAGATSHFVSESGGTVKTFTRRFYY